MSDKLTDEELGPLTLIDGSVGDMARELLAYRRASAAPATPARDDLLDKVEALDCLREMLGHVSNGSNEAVTISQDDATGVFIVRVGKARNWGWSLTAALCQKKEDEAALRDAGGTDGAPRDARGVWRRIAQDRQPLLQEGYTAVRAVSPGIWEVQGYGPATAHAGGTDGN